MTSEVYRNLVIEFDLPFVLRVEDSIRKESVPKGYKPYIFAIKETPAMLRFEKKVREIQGMQGMGIGFTGTGIATEDRNGLLNYSVAQVWLDRQFLNAFEMRGNFRAYKILLRNRALDYVNHFLSIYRDVTGLFWIRPIKAIDIPIFRMIGIKQNDERDHYSLGTLGTGRGLGTVVTSEMDRDIRQRLLQNVNTDHIQNFAYTIMNLFDKKEYWSSALAIEILFEAKVARMFRLAFKNQNLSDEDIDRKFITSKGQPRSISNLLETYFPKLTNIPLDDRNHFINTYYEDWKTKARDLRNAIAHGEELDISESDALNAINAVKGFLNAIEKLLPDVSHTKIDPNTKVTCKSQP